MNEITKTENNFFGKRILYKSFACKLYGQGQRKIIYKNYRKTVDII